MKKFVAIIFAMALVFAVQINFASAEDQPAAVPIESSKVYPKDLQKNLKYNGTVVISATVDEKGDVIKTVVMRSSGRPKVDKVAMEAASKWKFTPAVDKNGKHVEVWYMVKFEAKDF